VTVAVVGAGCATVSKRVIVVPASPVSPSSPRPQPVRTIVVSGPTYRAGHTATFHAQAGVVLRLAVSTPTTSTSRLSPSYGYPPQHGHYVSFRVTVANLGSRTVAMSPSYFYVRVPGQGKVTVTDGNAPYSGASAELDNTEIDPGQVDKGPLTFDVVRTHGKLVFAPDGSPAITWVF
jgi:hypothetical protein